MMTYSYASLVPRALQFLVLVCVQYNIHRSGRAVKNGETLGTPFMWMTSGGCEVDIGRALPVFKLVCNKQVLYHLSWVLSILWMSGVLVIVGVLVDEIQYVIWMWTSLSPYVHLASTSHHSCDRCSQAFPVFHHFRCCVLYWMQTEEQKRGSPGNEATVILYYYVFCKC